MSHYGMRQMEERHVSYQVDLMVWCNRLDLIAVSNFKGEVQVHRLHWQKVWSLSPPRESSKVTGMAWRPDGKALAVGYCSGHIVLVDVEDKEMLHSFSINDEEVLEENTGVTCMSWCVRAGEIVQQYNPYDDPELFLPSPPALATNFKSSKHDDTRVDLKKMHEQNQLNILIVGFGNGNVHMSVFGKFPCGVIDVNKVTNTAYDIKVINAVLSDNFDIMQIFYIDSLTNNLFLALVKTPILSEYHEELFLLSKKHSRIIHFLTYIDQTMTSISEAWEHILLEMESKLSDYAASVPEGGVSADFLDLLMTGVASDELEIFLVQELTDKGLKKIGSSVELSYSTIQKLVMKQLNIVGQNLAFYLTQLRGHSRIPDRFLILGLEESTVSNAIKSTFAFMSKCLELQQVIHHSMRDYKSFFRWLYVVILKLLEEPISSDIVKINQQELSYIAEFLYNFDNVHTNDESTPGEKKAVRFNLERLAQYLKDKELTILPDDEQNQWKKFLAENPCVTTDNDTIYSMAEFSKYSLVMQLKHLKKSVLNIFEHSERTIGKHFSLQYCLTCCTNEINTVGQDNYRVSQIFEQSAQKSFVAFVDFSTSQTNLCLLTLTLNDDKLYARGAKFYFKQPDFFDESKQLNNAKLNIVDFQFYSSDVISVILTHPCDEDMSIFVQLPLKQAFEMCDNIDLTRITVDLNHSLRETQGSSLLGEGVYEVMDKMTAYRLAVSGGRKVAIVLSKTKRKVRIFEMEVEGNEDDETQDITPQSQGIQSDLSQQSISIADASGISIINSSLEEENISDDVE